MTSILCLFVLLCILVTLPASRGALGCASRQVVKWVVRENELPVEPRWKLTKYTNSSLDQCRKECTPPDGGIVRCRAFAFQLRGEINERFRTRCILYDFVASKQKPLQRDTRYQYNEWYCHYKHPGLLTLARSSKDNGALRESWMRLSWRIDHVWKIKGTKDGFSLEDCALLCLETEGCIYITQKNAPKVGPCVMYSK